MSQISVVLIEDHDLTRVGLRTAFQQRREVKVIGEAANGKEGLELVTDMKPDIAIVDIGLPDIDGIELTRRLKKNGGSRDSKQKVLILTMQDNEETVLAAFAAGADSYCMKDVNLEKLIEALVVTQEGNNWVDPTIARIVLQQARHSSTSGRSAGFGGATRPKVAPQMNTSPEYNPQQQTSLTERELQVLELIVAGCSNAAIAEKLYITVGTVKTHVRNILNKLCADDRTQAAVRALRSGLVG